MHSVGETLPVCSLLGPLCHVPVIPLHRAASLRPPPPCVCVREKSPANKEQPSAHAKSRKGKGVEEKKVRDVNESVAKRTDRQSLPFRISHV